MTTVINLCFHGIGNPRRKTEPSEDAYWISTDLYHRVLDLAVDDPRVRLSFDDGNSSDVEWGLPGLEERGLRAAFFVLAGRLNRPGSLTEHDVRALSDAGMLIGSHGMDHRPWRGLDQFTVQRELVDARELIESAAGATVNEAALPLGRYDRRLLSEVRRRGYTRLHTSDRTWATADAWFQPRFSLRRDDTVESVRRQVLTRATSSHRARRAAVIAAKRLR